jgi:hypothetical protein
LSRTHARGRKQRIETGRGKGLTSLYSRERAAGKLRIESPPFENENGDE